MLTCLIGACSLYILLARLYLNGDRVANAISVLEMLRRSDLPRQKVAVVHMLLATVSGLLAACCLLLTVRVCCASHHSVSQSQTSAMAASLIPLVAY